ncbi:MAG: hypothetical protein HC893_03195 [Chloroflexaceae bacterium]|nr:hypothetical protein [Chloroflexaceae bacterium]
MSKTNELNQFLQTHAGAFISRHRHQWELIGYEVVRSGRGFALKPPVGGNGPSWVGGYDDMRTFISTYTHKGVLEFQTVLERRGPKTITPPPSSTTRWAAATTPTQDEPDELDGQFPAHVWTHKDAWRVTDVLTLANMSHGYSLKHQRSMLLVTLKERDADKACHLVLADWPELVIVRLPLEFGHVALHIRKPANPDAPGQNRPSDESAPVAPEPAVSVSPVEDQITPVAPEPAVSVLSRMEQITPVAPDDSTPEKATNPDAPELNPPAKPAPFEMEDAEAMCQTLKDNGMWGTWGIQAGAVKLKVSVKHGSKAVELLTEFWPGCEITQTDTKFSTTVSVSPVGDQITADDPVQANEPAVSVLSRMEQIAPVLLLTAGLGVTLPPELIEATRKDVKAGRRWAVKRLIAGRTLPSTGVIYLPSPVTPVAPAVAPVLLLPARAGIAWTKDMHTMKARVTEVGRTTRRAIVAALADGQRLTGRGVIRLPAPAGSEPAMMTQIDPAPTVAPKRDAVQGADRVSVTTAVAHKTGDGYEITCVECGRKFTARRRDATLCGSTCRKRYSRRADEVKEWNLRAAGSVQMLSRLALRYPDQIPAIAELLKLLARDVKEILQVIDGPTAADLQALNEMLIGIETRRR